MKYTRGYKEVKPEKVKSVKVPSKAKLNKYYSAVKTSNKLQEKARRERVKAAAERLRSQGYKISAKSVGAVQKLKGLTRKQTEAELLKRGTVAVGGVKLNAYTLHQARQAERREILSAERSQRVKGWFKLGKPKKAKTLQSAKSFMQELKDNNPNVKITKDIFKREYTKRLETYARNRGYKTTVNQYKKDLYVENFKTAFNKGYGFLPTKIRSQLKNWFSTRIEEWTRKNYEASNEADMVVGEYAYNSDGKSSLDNIARALGFYAEWQSYKDKHPELAPYLEAAEMRKNGKDIDMSSVKDNKIVPFKSPKQQTQDLDPELQALRAEKAALEMKYQSTQGVMQYDTTLASWSPEDKRRYSEINKQIFLKKK